MSGETVQQFDIAYKAREPRLSPPSLDALRTAAGLPFRSITVPVSILQAVLNDRDDWLDLARKIHHLLTQERALSGRLGATVAALREELDDEVAPS